MSLNVFGFQALWSPYLLGIITFYIILYFFITVKWRDEIVNSEPLKIREAVYFLLAMLLFYLVKGSPIDLLGHIMFTMHMTQMALLLLLVPIFVIKGIPNWLWIKIVNAPIVRSFVQLFTKPVLAIILFVALFSIYHIPVVFDAIKMNEISHMLYTTVLFIAALCMYWPLLNDIEGQHKMTSLQKLGYIAANAVLITPACALIIFASHSMYATYYDPELWMKAMALCVPEATLAGLSLSGPELFTNMSLEGDQQVGGVLMKIIQEIIFGVILFQVFTKWWNNERENADEITARALEEFRAQK